MSQTFSFGFSGDDIEDSEACEGDSRKARVENNNLQSKPGEEITPSLIPQKHSLHELVSDNIEVFSSVSVLFFSERAIALFTFEDISFNLYMLRTP